MLFRSALARETEATVLYITHDQAEAFALADRIGVLQSGRLVQCAAPETVYHEPATPFVARFTGIAGELHGRLAGQREDGLLRVETASGPVLASGSMPEQAGPDATVLIRPGATRLVPDPGTAGGEAGFPGRVEDTAYRGSGYDHLVELAGGARLSGVFDSARHQRGEPVRVGLDPAGCFAYVRDG